MTECTLFKPRVTFPLCELLYYKILIEAEPSVTPWFPLMSEAAVNVEAGVTSLNWGQGVKLHNRLFVCGFLSLPLSLPGLTGGCERQAASHQWPTASYKERQTVWWLEASANACLKPQTQLILRLTTTGLFFFVAVKSEQLSLVLAETGDVPGGSHQPKQIRIKRTSSQTTVYRFKATPAETPAPGKEVILVYFHSVAPVPSSSCLLLKTYLFVKSVPPPRSRGLCPPLPPPLPPFPRLELTWLILFPRTGSSSCLQLRSQPPRLAYSPHLPPPPSNNSKLLL